MDVLQVRNLTKRFGGFTAVDNISFSLGEGEILGLLGPNGAGKTTTIQMLLGVLTPTAGEVRYSGKDLKTHREEILEAVNFSSTYTNLPLDLTIRENLTFISYLYRIADRSKRLREITTLFQLEELLHKKFNDLSAGQQTRVNLAKAFINFPKVLLLDEPTASLDPDVANYIRQFLLNEQEKFNVSIVLTSHNMAEVEELCDRVVFINHGRVVADDTPENLAKSIEVCHLELMLRGDQLTALLNYCRTHNLGCSRERSRVTVDVKEREIADFLRRIAHAGIAYDEISIEKPTLEDYFLQAVRAKHETAPHLGA